MELVKETCFFRSQIKVSNYDQNIGHKIIIFDKNNLHTNINVSLGERIKELRERIKLSQKEMAGLLGVTRNTYSNYENDKTIPTFDIVLKLVKIGNVDITYFIGGNYPDTNHDSDNATLVLGDAVKQINQTSDIEELKNIAIELALKEKRYQDEIAGLTSELMKLLKELKG